MRFVILVALVLGGLAALTWDQGRTHLPRVSGILEAREIRIGSRVGGRIAAVEVVEGQVVEEGAVVVRLEPFDLRARLAQARANLAAQLAVVEKLTRGFRPEEIGQARARRDQARARLDEAIAGPRRQRIQEAQDALDLSRAQLKLAETDHRRVQELHQKRAAPQKDLDAAASQLLVAREQVDAHTAALALLEEGTRKEQIAGFRAQLEETAQVLALREAGFRAEEVAEARARMAEAEAAVRVIEAQLEELEVKAPCSGIIAALDVRPGDLVGPNAPVISIQDRSRIWVRSYVPQAYLGQVQPGRKIPVRIDAFPGREFTGTVSFLSTRGEFTPSNVQTPDQRSQEVFRVKVELDLQDPLQPGMTADLNLKPLTR